MRTIKPAGVVIVQRARQFVNAKAAGAVQCACVRSSGAPARRRCILPNPHQCKVRRRVGLSINAVEGSTCTGRDSSDTLSPRAPRAALLRCGPETRRHRTDGRGDGLRRREISPNIRRGASACSGGSSSGGTVITGTLPSGSRCLSASIICSSARGGSTADVRIDIGAVVVDRTGGRFRAGSEHEVGFSPLGEQGAQVLAATPRPARLQECEVSVRP